MVYTKSAYIHIAKTFNLIYEQTFLFPPFVAGFI